MWLVLGWLGCDKQAPSTDDTGPCTNCCGSEPTGPASIATLALTCEADALTWFTETAGWAGSGRVFAVDTASTTPWSEEHDLALFDDDACLTWAQLAVTVPARAGSETGTAPTYERNVSSNLTCDGLDGVTVAFALVDTSGAALECVAAGHDPQGLVDGTYDAFVPNDPSWDLAGCDLGALGR
ncbi:MAG: hypothetical protein ABMA64_16800 [Myxococcota bacterium]